MGTDDSVPVYVPFNSDTRTTTFAFIHSVTYNAYTYINKTYNKRMGFGRNIAFGVGTFGECIYSTHTTHNIQGIKHMALIPNFSMLPVSRDDTDEILALKKKLDTTVYDGDTLGVLASSFTLNEDILINAEPSLGVKSIRDNYIVSLPQVDSRDRDLTPLYTVNYVLVASPAQTHLAEGSQTVVEEAVNSFMNYADIATAYEEVPECETVIDGITIKLFHRVRDEHQADIKTFEARLYK